MRYCISNGFDLFQPAFDYHCVKSRKDTVEHSYCFWQTVFPPSSKSHQPQKERSHFYIVGDGFMFALFTFWQLAWEKYFATKVLNVDGGVNLLGSAPNL